MDFYSIEFAIFFSFVLLGLVTLKRQKYQHLFLIAAGYFFYWTTSSIFLFVLIYISIITFYAGDAIYRSENKNKKNGILILTIIASLFFLGLFKYYNFGVDNFNQILALANIDIQFTNLSLILPIGISFYTFSGLSYVFDIYFEKMKPEEYFYKYALFISYFPHLLAGPIVRAGQFLPQLKKQIQITSAGFKLGITLIVWGFFKKIVIADNLAPFINSVYSNPIGETSFTITIATLLFGIQIYCDFSGYIDIALGCAHIISLHLPKNFNRPYFSKSPTEFWRRWNITLSSFIKDYIYIPLGGNRKGNVRTYFNLIVTFLLCGLWHGAAWNFIIWGGYHGILLSIHKIIHNRLSLGNKVDAWFHTHGGLLIKILITQYFIFLGWVMFRSQNLQDLIYCCKKYIFPDFIYSQFELLILSFLLILVLIFILLLHNRKYSDFMVNLVTNDWILKFSGLKLFYWFIYLSFIMILLFMFSPSSSPEFIYFQF